MEKRFYCYQVRPIKFDCKLEYKYLKGSRVYRIQLFVRIDYFYLLALCKVN